MNKINKGLKKFIIIICCVLGAGSLIFAGLSIAKRLNRKPVHVYKVSDVSTSDFYGTSSETNGLVTTDKLQKVFPTPTQTITEVYVSEGDTVKQGEPLLAYDTSLTELDIRKAEIKVSKSKLELEEAEAELNRLYNAEITENLLAEVSRLENALADEIAATPGASPVYPQLPLGKFTAEEPYYLVNSGSFNPEDLFRLAEELTASNSYNGDSETQSADENEPETEKESDSEEETTETEAETETDPEPTKIDTIYLAFVTDSGGNYVDYKGIILSREPVLSFSFFDPEPLQSGEIQTSERIESLKYQISRVYELMSASYSKSELVSLQKEQERKIKDLTVQIKVDELDYREKLKEAGDGKVYAELDGIVKTIRSPEDASSNNKAILEVSGGGGYYIEGSISEMDIDKNLIGSTVQVLSWSTGAVCEGSILEIGDVPTSNSGFSNGNNNVSWYPLIVFVNEEADLIENDYVNVTYTKDANSNNWFLENMFIRYENGKPYVFVRGEDGLLEKRFISAGGDFYGQYTMILSGITQDDMICFPYGNGVEPGAKTIEGDITELYEN